jgi:hypothetical protein
MSKTRLWNLQRWAAPRAYSNRQMANMWGQMEFGGDHNGYAWQTSMMSREEMMRELLRCS